jgi:cytochrome c oxidase subunit 2
MTQLNKFRSGVRGGNPADVKGSLMRAMSMTLPDEQAMKDVIAYIMTLND